MTSIEGRLTNQEYYIGRFVHVYVIRNVKVWCDFERPVCVKSDI